MQPNNNICGVGVAHGASLGGINLLTLKMDLLQIEYTYILKDFIRVNVYMYKLLSFDLQNLISSNE